MEHLGFFQDNVHKIVEAFEELDEFKVLDCPLRSLY